MMIALFINVTKKQHQHLISEIVEFLVSHHTTVVMEDIHATSFGTKKLSETPYTEITCRISLGGDGTILQIMHSYPEIVAPILGINLGHLGFMADVPISNIYPSLLNLLQGNYKVEERLMIEGESIDKKRCFAVNDIVIHRASNPSTNKVS